MNAMKKEGVPLEPWGVALEALREGKGLTHEDLFLNRITTSGEYYRICRSKKGPGVITLHNLIVGMGCTWHHWAAEFEKAFIHKPHKVRPLPSEGKRKSSKKNLKIFTNKQQSLSTGKDN